MILALHIIVALSSLTFTAYMFFRPSVNKLRVSGGLIGGTVASGTVLMLTAHGHLLETCLMGLVYLAVTIFGTAASSRKLAAQRIRIK